ncbi:MAG TPA: class I SAM-dependent methyltransferase [Dehalococcoidia bacterium]|jgi:SAM-dependent methyltransferase
MRHWTEQLFEDNPKLFLNILRQLNPQARTEIRDILRLLAEQEHQPRRVLDLNCGIGRHSIELAKCGIQVLGTDISPVYIKLAAERAHKQKLDDKVSFKVVDMRKIQPALASEKPFDGIMCLWTSFGFYDDETNDDILRQCLKLVKPGGFFAMDIVNRDWLLRNFQDRRFERINDRLILYDNEFDPETSRHKDKWTFMKQTGDDTFRTEGVFQLDLRVWSLHELIQLFERTGWKFERAYPGMPGTHGLRQIKFTSPEDDLVDAGRFLIVSSKPGRA